MTITDLIKGVVDEFYRTPCVDLVKSKDQHIELLKSMRDYFMSNDDEYLYKINNIIGSINECWVELQAYKEIDPPEFEERYHDFLTGDDYIIIPKIVFGPADSLVECKYEEDDSLPF